MTTFISNQRKKRHEIEWLRILSAFGIVWFHTSNIGKNVAYAGLAAFLIISLFLAAKQKPILERMNRLLTPWGFWMVFYGLLNLARKEPIANADYGVFFAILAGTAQHLWYLPFIFFVIVFFDQLRTILPTKLIAYLCVTLAALLMLFVNHWRPTPFELAPPLGQYLHALIGVLVGVLFASRNSMPPIIFAILWLLIIYLLCSYTLNFEGVGVPYLIGILSTSFVLLPRWNFQPSLNLNWLADCTLGIYLAYPFFFLIVMKFLVLAPLAIPFVVFALTAFFVWALKKFMPKIAKSIV